MVSNSLYVQTINTPYGRFQAAARDTGITSIVFPGRRFCARGPKTVSRKAKAHLLACGRLLNGLLAGKTFPAHRLKVQVDWNQFGAFEKRVFKALFQVPKGAVISYGELARRSGSKRAARAVGNALKRNPVPILIPCHRVVRCDHSLGGFQSGIRWKRTLLHLEQNAQPGKRKSLP